MQQRSQHSMSWPAVLAALRVCSGEGVHIRDGRALAPAGDVRNRPAAKGTELCLFPAETPVARVALIAQLELLAKQAGRRFMIAAKARAADSALVIEGVGDEVIDDATVTVVRTRRPKLGYNQSMQTGDSTTLRSKRIKTG